jgi:hypothetical protein
VGCNKKSRRGGMLGLLNLRQGSAVPPDSSKTVLRSRLGRNYRQLPTSERYARAARCADIVCQQDTSRGGIGSSRRDLVLASPVIVLEVTFGCLVTSRSRLAMLPSQGIGLTFSDRLSIFACGRVHPGLSSWAIFSRACGTDRDHAGRAS